MAATENLLPALWRGAVAGLLSAAPMSLALNRMYRLLPAWQRYTDPPREITLKAATRVGLDELVDEEPEASLTTAAAHLGYSAFAGLLYAFFSRGLAGSRLGWAGSGVLFSLVLWAASYFGWVPAVGLLSPPTRQPAQRVWMMIAAHLVYGLSTAGLYRVFRRRQLDMTGEMG